MKRRETGWSKRAKAEFKAATRQDPGDPAGMQSRRRFIRGAGQAALVAALGVATPWGRFVAGGLVPGALASEGSPGIAGKEGLIVLGDKPLNAETPAWLLDDDVTPVSRLFVRNNGIPPEPTDDPEQWALEIGGESCLRPRSFSLAELQERFTTHTRQLLLECAGNGRAEFSPPASGNPWAVGAVGCPQWTGVRLRDVLEECGIADNAVYIGYYGSDKHLSGDPARNAISRGVPMSKALEDETLLAWAVNGEPLPLLHGFPLRLVCGGWPASTSGKWLTRIVVRDRVHDGEHMGESSYRVPCEPIAPGATTPDSNMCIIESLPVKSLITFPRSGVVHDRSETLVVRGHAWAGDKPVKAVFLSADFGATWSEAQVREPANRLAWQNWNAGLKFPARGYYEVWARAVDADGVSQPMVLPGWNPKGYLNNACHRIAVQVV